MIVMGLAQLGVRHFPAAVKWAERNPLLATGLVVAVGWRGANWIRNRVQDARRNIAKSGDSQTGQPISQASAISKVASELHASSGGSNRDPMSEIRTHHCAVVAGISADGAAAYLIPNIGDVFKTDESIPEDALPAVKGAAKALRQQGISTRMLKPVNPVEGAYFPPVGHYTLVLPNFSVPRSFLSWN